MHNRRWLIIALVISLAANLALGGFLMGRMSHGGPAPAMLDPSLSLVRVMRHLPEERREVLRPTLREHFRHMRGDLRRMRSAQRGINAALEQEPFDPAALETALGAFRAALVASQEDNHHLLVRVAAEMSAAERVALREAMVRRRPGFGDPPRSDHGAEGRSPGAGPHRPAPPENG